MSNKRSTKLVGDSSESMVESVESVQSVETVESVESVQTVESVNPVLPVEYRIPVEIFAGKHGKEAQIAVRDYTLNVLNLKSADGETHVLYGASGVWNAPKSMIVGNGTFRTRIGFYLSHPDASGNPTYESTGQSADGIAKPRAAKSGKLTGLNVNFRLGTGEVEFRTPDNTLLTLDLESGQFTGKISNVWTGVLNSVLNASDNGIDLRESLRKYANQTVEFRIDSYSSASASGLYAKIDVDIQSAVESEDAVNLMRLMKLRKLTAEIIRHSVDFDAFCEKWIPITESAETVETVETVKTESVESSI